MRSLRELLGRRPRSPSLSQNPRRRLSPLDARNPPTVHESSPLTDMGWIKTKQRSTSSSAPVSLVSEAGRQDTGLRASATRALGLSGNEAQPGRRSSLGEGREFRSGALQASREGARQNWYEGRCDSPLEEPGLYEALLGVFNELTGSGDSEGSLAKMEQELSRLQEENVQLKRNNQELGESLEAEAAGQEASPERRPNHDIAPLPGILRGRRPGR